MDVPAGPLYQFFAQLPTHQYTIFDRKAHSSPKFGAFYDNLLKIHQIYAIWAPLSVMKTHRSLYHISKKKTTQKAGTYMYHVNVRTSPGVDALEVNGCIGNGNNVTLCMNNIFSNLSCYTFLCVHIVGYILL